MKPGLSGEKPVTNRLGHNTTMSSPYFMNVFIHHIYFYHNVRIQTTAEITYHAVIKYRPFVVGL
jgi:hypothetical protein